MKTRKKNFSSQYLFMCLPKIAKIGTSEFEYSNLCLKDYDEIKTFLHDNIQTKIYEILCDSIKMPVTFE